MNKTKWGEELVKRHMAAFGDEFKMWSGYGWWLEEIDSLLKELMVEVEGKKIKDIKEFDSSDYTQWGQTYTDHLIERKRWTNSTLDDVLSLIKSKQRG